jgi:hypothetical protein
MTDDRQVFKVNTQKAKETKQRLQEESQRTLLPMWKIPEGKSKLRILPPWSEAGEVGYQSASHWRIPPNDRMFNCLKIINKECPLCEMVEVMRQKAGKDKDKKKKINEYAAKKSIYYNVVVRGEEEKGVQIMRSGPRLYENILSYLYDEDYDDVTDIDNGMDCVIERTGQGLDTSYTVKFGPKQSPLHEKPEVAQRFINGMFDLDTIMQYKDTLELEEAVKNFTGKRAVDVEEPEALPQPVLDVDAKVVGDDSEERKGKITDELKTLLEKGKN